MFYIKNAHGLSEQFTTTLKKNNKNGKDNKDYNFKTVCLRAYRIQYISKNRYCYQLRKCT